MNAAALVTTLHE